MLWCLNMGKFSLTINIKSSCVNGRSKRVGGFAGVQTAILDPNIAYVHVADDVTCLIDVLPNCVSVAHIRRCKQFSVQQPRELGRWTACGRAVK